MMRLWEGCWGKGRAGCRSHWLLFCLPAAPREILAGGNHRPAEFVFLSLKTNHQSCVSPPRFCGNVIKDKMLPPPPSQPHLLALGALASLSSSWHPSQNGEDLQDHFADLGERRSAAGTRRGGRYYYHGFAAAAKLLADRNSSIPPCFQYFKDFLPTP